MHIKDCPKFDCCNAPICPLDPAWRNSAYLHGEGVCFYLRQASKSRRVGPQGYVIEGETPNQIATAHQAIVHGQIRGLKGQGELRALLARAAVQPSRASAKPQLEPRK